MFLIALTAGGVFLATLWWLFFSNKFTVDPNNRERLVIQNGITGNMAVLGPGVWFKAVWWKKFQRVDLNREPIKVTGEEVRTSDGTLVLVDYRYDIVAGRPFNEDTGELKFPADAQDTVDDKTVILAVTRIDYEQHVERVAQQVSAALEEELGQYNPHQLVSPAKDPVRIRGRRIKNAADLYDSLEQGVGARTDKKLTFVGLNGVGFEIIGIKAKDPRLQADVEKQARSKQIAQGAKEMMDRAKAAGGSLTYREAIATGDPDFAKVVLAEAGRDVGNALSKGGGDGLKAIAKGLEDGLKNVGKGP